jgi:DNA-binding IscR family transcriptional regulator
MREIIETIEGPLSLNVCVADNQPCPRKVWCPAHPVWVKAQEAVLNVLSAARIADVADTNHFQFPVTRAEKSRTGNQD